MTRRIRRLFPPRTSSLVTYFGSAYWLVAMVIVTLAVAIFFAYNGARTEQQVRGMARAVAETLAATTAREWEDEAFLSRTLEQAASLPNIAFVRARRPDGTVLASAGDVEAATETIWTEEAPVAHLGRQVGTVEVAIVRSAARSIFVPWMRIALALTLASTVASAIAARLLAVVTTRPLRALKDATVHWEQPLMVPPDWEQGPREVQELGRAVMAMRERALARTADLAEEVLYRTQQLRQAYAALDKSFLETAAALAQVLEARDHLTANHSNRTAELVSRIARRMGLSESEQRTMFLAATLHDIGKIGVPEHILTKPGKLTSEEMAVMRTHPVIAAEILERISGMQEVAKIVRHHHERWDGTGYPDGLTGEEIPLGSRILALADTVEAMCAHRHYRGPKPAQDILVEIRRCTGTQFDPEVVKVGWPEIVRTVYEWAPPSVQPPEAKKPVAACSGCSGFSGSNL